MDYPSGFPIDLHPPVDAALHDAEREYIDAKKLTKGQLWEIDPLIIKYIQKVFKAFALRACRAEELGHWDGPRVRREIEAFRQDLTRHTILDKHPKWQSEFTHGDLQRDVKRTIENSE